MLEENNNLDHGGGVTEQDLAELQILPTPPSSEDQINAPGGVESVGQQPIHSVAAEQEALKYRPITELNDHELALIFKEAGISRYVRHAQKKEYYHYDGGVWQYRKSKDDLLQETHRLVEFYREAHRFARSPDDLKVAEKNLASAGNIRVFSKMLCAIQTSPDLKVQAQLLDQKDCWLNTQNYTIDLKSGDALAHNPDHLLTQIIPVVFDAKATCPIWEAFVAQTQDNDAERIGHLHKAVGYSLSAYNHENALFYLVGKPGTGKSTFMEILMELLGTYATPLQQSILYRQSADVTTKLAALKNMRVAYLPEMDKEYKISEGLVKQLTGADRFAARNLYSSQHTLKPTWKIWIAANQNLRIEAPDSALFRRWHPIEFTRFKGNPDRNLMNKLKDELPGILNWALRGFREYQKNGLALPKHGELIKESLRASLDPLSTFLDKQVETCSGKRVGSTELYNRYQEFRIQNRYEEISQKKFSAGVAERLGILPSKSQGKQYFKGIRLK